jgi:uncharacterized protein (TIGR02246 family)
MDFRAAIEKAIASFEKAFNGKDAATMAKLYEEGATLLPPGSLLVKGRVNIQAFWQSFINAGGSDAKLRPIDVEASGDMAYEVGAFEANLPLPQGGTARGSGKYVVIWKRQSDGSVKMAVDIFNANA